MKKVILSTIVAASLAFAVEQPYEVGLTLGGTSPESDLKLDNHSNYGIRFGIENNLILENIFDTIEFAYERSKDADYDNSTLETNVNRYSVNMLHNFGDFEALIPYGLVGLGYEDFSKELRNTNDSVTTNLGLGLKYFLTDNVSVRGEVRDQINLESDIEHELIYTVGLGYAFGATSKKAPELVLLDTDGDGVYDKDDKCPNTPAGVTVNSDGCPILLDTDGDGIYDKDDKCPNTLKGFNVDSDGCAIDYNLNVNFDTNKYFVKELYNEKLIKFVDFMNMMPQYKAQINGYTDSMGAESYNMKLSEKRAKSVMGRLIELGIDKDRLTYKGYGIQNPVASNETKDGRAENRRVEAQIIK